MDGEQLNGSLENMTEDQAIAALKARREELERQAEANIEARLTVELQQDTIGRLSRMDALQQQAMAHIPVLFLTKKLPGENLMKTHPNLLLNLMQQ